MSVRHIAAAVIGCACLTTVAYAQPPAHRHRGINAREHRQVQRIKQGVKSGEITKAEKNRLKADEAAIRAEERVYRKSGGGLSKAERKDLNKDLHKSSREIYRAKHNKRDTK
jgi:hypothetical protein